MKRKDNREVLGGVGKKRTTVKTIVRRKKIKIIRRKIEHAMRRYWLLKDVMTLAMKCKRGLF